MHLTIVAHITAIQGKADLVRTDLGAQVAPTRDLLQNHMQANHIKAFGQITTDVVADVTVHKMSKIA